MDHRPAVFTLLLLLTCLTVVPVTVRADCAVVEGAKTIQKLKTIIFCNYDLHERPVRNRTANVTVDVSLEIKRIQVNDYTNTNEIMAWVTVVWHDEYLKWNMSDYDGIEQFETPSYAIWTPDISVYNSESPQAGLFMNSHCVVSHWGRVLCVPSMRSPIFCEQELQNWPRDIRKCKLYVGSWSYNGNQLDVQLYYEGYTLFGYNKNYEWDMTSISVKKHVTYYPCCPKEPYVFLLYDIILARHAELYTATVIAPAFILAGVTLMSFWIRGVTCRALVCVAALLGNVQFLQFVGHILPANGDTSPTIVSYYRDAMLLSAVSLLAAICVWCLEACATPQWLEGVTVWIRGRGGKPGQLLLGEVYDKDTDMALEKNVKSQCSAAATLLDRATFLVFSTVYIILLTALLPNK